MTLITKPDMEFIWASGGAIVEPSDVKKQTGWTPEVPPHQWENWIQNRQDKYLAHINQRGIPEWDGNTEYEAAGLSYVQGSDGVVYKSVAASGPATTVQDPTTDISDTYWTTAFANADEFLTEAEGDVRYTQRSNNLSDLSNIPTARINLGVQNAVVSGVQSSFSNLKISTTGTSTIATVTANSVCLKNSSNEQIVVNSVSVTPNLATSGANGLDTGSSTVLTWYNVWLIWNPTTSTLAGLLSLSATSPTMPSGYTYKARVGAVYTDSSGSKNFFPYFQEGKKGEWRPASGKNITILPVLASGVQGTVGSTGTLILSSAVLIPPTAGVLRALMFVSGTSTQQLSATGNMSLGAGSPAVTVSTSTTTISLECELVIGSAGVYYAGNATSVNCTASVLGWEDNL